MFYRNYCRGHHFRRLHRYKKKRLEFGSLRIFLRGIAPYSEVSAVISEPREKFSVEIFQFVQKVKIFICFDQLSK